jgi:hypothetical protein
MLFFKPARPVQHQTGIPQYFQHESGTNSLFEYFFGHLSGKTGVERKGSKFLSAYCTFSKSSILG